MDALSQLSIQDDYDLLHFKLPQPATPWMENTLNTIQQLSLFERIPFKDEPYAPHNHSQI